MLIFVYEKSSVRHREIAKLVKSRGTLSLVLNALMDEGLIIREVKTDFTPIQTFYIITEKGKRIAEKCREIMEILEE